MANRVLDLRTVSLPTPPAIGSLAPLAAARRWHVHQMMLSQDTPLTGGRRVWAEMGLRGASDNLTPETDPASGGTSTHADASTEYIYGRAEGYVTPGHRLKFSGWVLPSGEVQKFDSPNYVSDGRPGQIHITSSWEAQGVASPPTYTTDQTVDLAPSAADFGAVSSAGEAAFAQMTRIEGFIYPPTAFADMEVTRELSNGLTRVSLSVALVGGARIVDLVIYEEPGILVMEDADPMWPAHVYADSGQPAQGYPYTYCQEDAPAGKGDDRFTWDHMLATAWTIPRQTGPTLMSWSAGSDDDAVTSVVAFGSGTGDDAMVSRAVTSTSFDLLTRSGKTQGDTAPGWSMRAGVYGRDYKQSGREHILPETGVVRVHCAVYAKPTSTTTLTVRFYVSPWSYIDLEHTASAGDVSTGYQWLRQVGWLECGRVPDDDKRLWVSAKVDSSQWDVRAVTVHHMPEVILS